MATVLFKRTDDQSTVPIQDGLLVFDTSNHKIYMDNGTERLQYGGDTDLITDPTEATITNAFSATGSLNLFLQKTTVVDTKSNALAVTQNYIPLGCLAFKEMLGTTNYANAYEFRGIVYKLLGNIQQAKTDFAKAKELSRK